MHEVYEALDNDLHVLAAMGMRIVFDVSAQMLGVDPELPSRRSSRHFSRRKKTGSALPHLWTPAAPRPTGAGILRERT